MLLLDDPSHVSDVGLDRADGRTPGRRLPGRGCGLRPRGRAEEAHRGGQTQRPHQSTAV